MKNIIELEKSKMNILVEHEKLKMNILIKLEELKKAGSINEKYDIIYRECIDTLKVIHKKFPINTNKESIRQIVEYATIMSSARTSKEFDLITGEHFDNEYIIALAQGFYILEMNKNKLKSFIFACLLFIASISEGYEINIVLNILSAENIGNYEVLNFLIDNNVIGFLNDELCILEMYPDWYELYNIYQHSNKKQTWEYNNLTEINTVKEKHITIKNEKIKKMFRILKI